MYKLGTKSLGELTLVDPRMIQVVKRAIQITTQDFAVNDGGRTAEEQNKLFKSGATQKDGYKNKSNHQCAADGFGKAVDLVPWVNGRKEFADWNYFYPIAAAMSAASKELGIDITWGGNWYEKMSEYGSSVADMRAAVERYKKNHPGPDFIDGPHFQLS
jgi:peptidoglycan L-alanyl-D-glutamate endopeptidase CwlK